jgi:hypothetical protein
MPPAAASLTTAHVLALQRLAGNHATTRMLARAPQPRMLQRTLADANEGRHPPFFTILDCIAHLRALPAGSTEYQPLRDALLKDLDPGLKVAVERTLDAAPVVAMDEEEEEEQPRSSAAELLAQFGVADDEGSDYEGEQEQRGKKRKTRARPSLADTQTTRDTFRGAKRRRTDVTAELETIKHVSGQDVQRPTRVAGLVEPRTTKGRPGAPEPSSGLKVGVKWKEVGSADTRNTGIVDAQKGHIMALELGGPDKPWNIVPQWGNWQANGEWRKSEVQIHEAALEAQERGHRMQFVADVKYKRYQDPTRATFKGLTVPTSFVVTIQEVDEDGEPVDEEPQVIFDGEQHQDATDFKISARVFDRVDPLDPEDVVAGTKPARGKQRRRKGRK